MKADEGELGLWSLLCQQSHCRRLLSVHSEGQEALSAREQGRCWFGGYVHQTCLRSWGRRADWNLGPRALVLPLDGYETSGESLNLSALLSPRLWREYINADPMAEVEGKRMGRCHDALQRVVYGCFCGFCSFSHALWNEIHLRTGRKPLKAKLPFVSR